MKAIQVLLFLVCVLPVHGQFECGTSTVTDVDGNVYNTVQIGSRCWMKENMRALHYPNGEPAGMAEHLPGIIQTLVCQPGRLQLSLPLVRQEFVRLLVFNLAGEVVYRTAFTCTPGNHIILCTLGPGGVYIVQVIVNESKATFKAIGASSCVISATLEGQVSEKASAADSIILTATSRYIFDYNHDPALGLQYGKLYTPMAALNTADYSGIIQGICPTGWHVPTDSEWMELEISCGMSPFQANDFKSRGNIAYKLMIEGAEWHYEVGTDDFGFAAKGSGWYGQYINGVPSFVNLNGECKWFTYSVSTQPQNSLISRMLNSLDVGVVRWPTFPEAAASIRCIKDQ